MVITVDKNILIILYIFGALVLAVKIMYSIGKFAEKLGVTIQTLRNWDKEGKLSPIKLDSGHRRYTEEYLLKALNYNRPEFQKM